MLDCRVLSGIALALLVACASTPSATTPTKASPAGGADEEARARGHEVPVRGHASHESLARALAEALGRRDSKALYALTPPRDVLATLCAGETEGVARALEAYTTITSDQQVPVRGVEMTFEGAVEPDPNESFAQLEKGETLTDWDVPCTLTRSVGYGEMIVSLRETFGKALMTEILYVEVLVVDGRWFLMPPGPFFEQLISHASSLRISGVTWDAPRTEATACRIVAMHVDAIRRVARELTDQEALARCQGTPYWWTRCLYKATTPAELDACEQPATIAGCERAMDHVAKLAGSGFDRESAGKHCAAGVPFAFESCLLAAPNVREVERCQSPHYPYVP